MTSATGSPLDLDLTRLEDGQLGALVKTVHEARFPDQENDPVVWLSPFAVELHVAAVQEQRDRRLRSFAGRAARGEDVVRTLARKDAGWYLCAVLHRVVHASVDADGRSASSSGGGGGGMQAAEREAVYDGLVDLLRRTGPQTPRLFPRTAVRAPSHQQLQSEPESVYHA